LLIDRGEDEKAFCNIHEINPKKNLRIALFLFDTRWRGVFHESSSHVISRAQREQPDGEGPTHVNDGVFSD
jgi:hypothetical protein